jgi:hypothetical protein
MSFFPKHQQNECGQATEQLLIALRAIEHHRNQLDQATGNLQRLLRIDADMHKLWSKFTLAGGLSSGDLVSFIEGRFRHRRVRQRQHLRLVSSRKQGISRVRRGI